MAVASPSHAKTSSGDVLFQGNRASDFWLEQSAPGAVSEVADPAGGDETAMQLTVGDRDVYPITPTENPRAELLSPPLVEPGDELWWSGSFYLPGTFPSSVPGWLVLLEGPYGKPYDGTPPWQIAVEGDQIEWSRNGTYGWDVPWRMPLVRESWVHVTVHEKFETEGWVEMWIDGRKVTFFDGTTFNPNRVTPTQRLAMQTMDASNDDGPNSIYVTSYRKVGMFESVTVDHGPLTIATTQAAVEG